MLDVRRYQQGDETGNPDDREAAEEGIGDGGADKREEVDEAVEDVVDLGGVDAFYVEFGDQEYDEVVD